MPPDSGRPEPLVVKLPCVPGDGEIEVEYTPIENDCALPMRDALSGFETGGERLQVALDNGDQHKESVETGQSWLVYPRERLSAFQCRMMATQPDMILSFAQHLERERAAQGSCRRSGLCGRLGLPRWAPPSTSGRPQRGPHGRAGRMVTQDLDRPTRRLAGSAPGALATR